MLQLIVSFLFSLFINLWALLNLVLALGTSHAYDSIALSYRFVVMASLIISPLTSIFLIKSIRAERPKKWIVQTTAVLLILTGLIFVYDILEMWTDEYSSGTTIFYYLPIIALAIASWLFWIVVKKGIDDPKTS